jgi:hypothetical protein
MKKHSLYIIMIVLVLSFIFLCYSGTPLNSENMKSGKGFPIRSSKNSGSDKYRTHKKIIDKFHNTQKMRISKSFSRSKPISFIKKRINQIPSQKFIPEMPEMIVRNDIDFKIYKMRVRPEMDYKILQAGPKKVLTIQNRYIRR